MSIDAWRVVEGQHRIATRKLVDSDAEHRLLEELIESKKPPCPAGKEFVGLHYLLYTPFRYPPLRYGSRFGGRDERSLWYGSEQLSAAFAESAYYRMVFLDGTQADLGHRTVELSTFCVPISSRKAIDLTAPPFDAHHAAIASPSSYLETQRLGSAMRRDGVEAFRYPSARDPQQGRNVGLFSPAAFGAKTIKATQTWFCSISRTVVELRRKTFFDDVAFYRFVRADFEVDGVLPRPAP
jgi:hypothetical protein